MSSIPKKKIARSIDRSLINSKVKKINFEGWDSNENCANRNLKFLDQDKFNNDLIGVERSSSQNGFVLMEFTTPIM
jgi:hypothetical protein